MSASVTCGRSTKKGLRDQRSVRPRCAPSLKVRVSVAKVVELEVAAAPSCKLEEFGKHERFQQRCEDRAIGLQPLWREIPQGREQP
jgi:hypothetical protein